MPARVVALVRELVAGEATPIGEPGHIHARQRRHLAQRLLKLLKEVDATESDPLREACRALVGRILFASSPVSENIQSAARACLAVLDPGNPYAEALPVRDGTAGVVNE